VKLAGGWHHLGKPGTPQAAARYDALLWAYLASGREPPSQQPAPQSLRVHHPPVQKNGYTEQVVVDYEKVTSKPAATRGFGNTGKAS